MISTTEGNGARAAAKTRLENLTPEQRQRIEALARAKRTATATLHGAFEASASRHPDAVAVVCEGSELTYAELGARSSALAKRMVAMSLSKGDLVAITLDRGLDLIVAILAVLKAGGAYLPIDPSVPEERQRFIRSDAGARIAITSSFYRGLFDDNDDGVILMDRLQEFPAVDDGIALPAVLGDDLAYVIYTSGSTGKPKGVMIEHRNVMRLFAASERHFDFNDTDVWTLFHSYAFDFSVWEIWGALLYGGRLVVVPYAVSRTPAEFAGLVIAEGVTVLNQTPTAFSNLMTEMLSIGDAGRLRYVVFGGEALEPRRLQRWFEKFGDERPALINMYGITETTVHVTYKRVGWSECIAGISDIGAPLEHLSLYVLNDRRKQVPIGAVGELYVGGAGVSRGYLNRPELTEKRFIQSPFAEGERLYKTGDLARRLESGALEYMGRNDDQVKLRGFRMELGDIERQLIGHDTVLDAVVAVKGEGEDRALVAYLVLGPTAGDDWKQDLHRHLTAALPSYMVPSYLVVMDRLPVTNNGKIDRDALPVQAADDVWVRPYVEPTNRIEADLCALYSSILKIERVGIHDNFFALGGDSLKTVNLVAQAKAAGLEFGIADIFAHPAVINLAGFISARGSTGSDSSVSTVEPFELITAEDRASMPDGIEDAYPMSQLQQGMVYHNLASADNSHYHNVISQRYAGVLDLDRMRRAIGNLIAAHEILRTSFNLEGFSEPMQLVHRHAETPLVVTDLRGCAEEDQTAVMESEIRRLRAERIDLATPPLFKALIYRVSDEHFELIWLEHHAILDGWSLASFMTQLSLEYAALERGTSALLASPARYNAFIVAEKRAMNDPEQAEFWKKYVSDAHYTQLQSEPSQDGEKQIAPIEMSTELFARCRELAAVLGVPLKSLFLAAYSKVVAKFSNETELLVGLTTHGRPEIAGGDNLLGLYVSTHPLRVDCSAGSWRDLIQACFRSEAEIWARRHYPFSEIKRANGDRDLFETTFTYNHFSVTEGAEDIGIASTRSKRAFELDDTGIGVAFVVMDMKADKGQIHVAFDSARFDDRFAARILEYLLLSLERMTDDVNGVADVLSVYDRRCITELAEHVPGVNTGDSLVREFGEQVRLHADRVAIEYGEVALGYEALDYRSNRLAARLRENGVSTGSLVGFDTIPSAEMIIALIAVWKIGAVFVPLDPEQSASRLSDIVEESGLADIIADTQRRQASLPPGVRLHSLSQLMASCEGGSPIADIARTEIAAEDTAYVIYTSGSTGKPKGVVINHGNAVSFLRAIRNRYRINAGERLLQVSNIGFDIFIEEILISLFSGGTLVLRETPLLPDALEFWELIDRREIQLLSLPTAYWNLLCMELQDGSEVIGRSLRLCIVGGEVMQTVHAERWLSNLGTRVALINSYGPTEATVAATTCDVRDLLGSSLLPASIPIGRPLDNCPCWVLGKDMAPVPQGVSGELYIGGEAISVGYLRNPEQTSLKFLEVGTVPGVDQRLYRTGDLVRITGDRQIEYIGRIDGQVKIRGFRVELDEVRHAISQHPAVRQSVVATVRHTNGDNRLVAYLVMDAAADSEVLIQIQQNTKSRLPGYMRPAAWVRLETLPMTPNRKIDMAALPVPSFDDQDNDVAPATDIEHGVQALWEVVLDRRSPSVEADFFAIGGHSLLLTRLLLRIGQTFDVELSMVELMRARTIREMAGLIEAARSVSSATEAVGALDEMEQEW